MEPNTSAGMKDSDYWKNTEEHTKITAHNTHKLLQEVKALIDLNKKVIEELEQIKRQR